MNDSATLLDFFEAQILTTTDRKLKLKCLIAR